MPDVLTAPAPPLHPLKPLKTSYRIDSIDLLRGLVMIIMALDHTRDFFHKDAWSDDPLNLATTTPILYFTRWITHLCAPIFVFLAGSGAYFQSLRKNKKQLSLFLIKRGLWLFLIEIVVLGFAFSFDIHYSLFVLQTIWSIGMSMIVLGLMIWLPFRAIFVLGLIIVLGHNSLDFYEKNHPNTGLLYDLIHRPGQFPLWGHHALFIFYPFLPWSGLMMMGYCFGKFFLKFEGIERKKALLWLGFGVIAFFIVLRATNTYGDPGHWTTQKNSLFTFLSFMKVQKYPPSLLYMCATVGTGILFLAFAGNVKNGVTKFITVYGRVPFLYYILHFFLIHTLTMIFFLIRGHSFSEGVHPGAGGAPNFIIPGEGYSLSTVYIIWICVVLSLYPVCRWFSEYKQAHREKWWLSYL
ncbi:MAG: DUF1624 domain-containing protein [Chitinophagales bacterium]